MKKILLSLACLLVSMNVFADQESQKSRLDDCFAVVGGMLDQMNSVQGTTLAPAFGQAFTNKKAQCYQYKSEYEKKYGSYKVPLPKVKVVHINPNKLDEDQVIKYFCSSLENIKFSQNQIEILKNENKPELESSIKINEQSIINSKAEINILQRAFKKRFKGTLEESECDEKKFSEKKYISSLKRNAEVDSKGKKLTDDKNPKKLKDLFCHATDQEKEILSKLHKKVTGEDIFCKSYYAE